MRSATSESIPASTTGGGARWTAALLAGALAVAAGLASGRAATGSPADFVPPVAAAPRAPAAPAGTVANPVFLPALDYGGDDADCTSSIQVMNLGPGPAKAVLVLWPAAGANPCDAPAEVRCTGLLRAGSAWTFQPAADETDAGGGALYSFSLTQLSDLGVTVPGNPLVADYMCQRLAATVVNDCAAYAAFAAAFAQGGAHFGVPMDQAAGSPLAVQVHRSCAGDTFPGVLADSSYAGVGAQDLGAADATYGGYRYHAAPLHADRQGLSSWLHVQNAGAAPTQVELWLQADDGCTGGTACPMVAIDPGATALVDVAACAGAAWAGSARFRSAQPLAITVDTVGRDTRSTFTGMAPGVATGPTGLAVPEAARFALIGPLAPPSEYGWDVEVTVQGLGLAGSADVLVALLDAHGAVLDSQSAVVCPGGSSTVLFPVSAARPGQVAGSVRVVSRAPASPPGAAPVPIAAVATLRQFGDTQRTINTSAAAYNLVPAPGLAAPGGGTDAPDTPVVAVPTWWKDLDGSATVNELAVSNLASAPGWTDFAVLVYDQNDLVDVYCRRLGAGETTYINPEIMGLVSPGFRGSAVVSATYWEHPVTPAGGAPTRHEVALGAVLVTRTGTRLGEDVPGDELAAEAGIGLPAWPDAAALPPDPCGMGLHAFTAPTGGTWQSVVPVLADFAGRNGRFSIRNIGQQPTEVRVLYAAAGDCLRQRICTVGPLAPGEIVPFAASDCVGPYFFGTAVVHATQPLTVTAELIGEGPPVPVPAWPGRLPYDVTGDGRVDTADRAAVQAALGASAGGPGWNPRLDLDASGTIDAIDLDIVTMNLCGADRAADAPPADPPAARAAAVQLPVLADDGPRADCAAAVSAQNVGEEPVKVALITWGEPAADGSCRGPLAVTCGGVVRPGGAWHFGGADIPAGARGGLLVGFSLRTLAEIGAPGGGDEPAADYLCRTLAGAVVGDCAVYQGFRVALDAGARWNGVPMDRGAPGGLVADVRRECEADLTADIMAAQSYAGLGGAALGARDPALGAWLTYVPVIYGDKAGFQTEVWAQNAGAVAATATLWAQGQDDCSGAMRCGTLAIAAGNTANVLRDVRRGPDDRSCLYPDWQGNAWLESDQPLAVLAETRGRDVRFSFPGVAPAEAFDANGAPLPAGGRTLAFGPVPFGYTAGWDTGVQVQNLDRTRPAQVRVEFADARGGPLAVVDDLICAAGAQTFFLPVIEAREAVGAMTVRVISQRLHGDPAAVPAPIAANVLGIRYSDAARNLAVAAGAMPLAPERQSLARQPATPGGPAAGIGAVALGGVAGSGPGVAAGSQILVSNLAHAPGWTDVIVGLFDANGLVAVQCRRLVAGAVATVDVASPLVAPGFRGGAVVSATAWSHPVGGTGGRAAGNQLGLAAVVVAKTPPGPGDSLGLSAGVPLAVVPAVLAADLPDSCEPGPSVTATPTATATLAATPTATATLAATPTPTITASPTTPGATPATATRTATPVSTPVATPTATAPAGTGTAVATVTLPAPTPTLAPRWRIHLPWAGRGAR